MTAPVVGSGSCPAWMQRVEKSSWFFCDIQASHSGVSPASHARAEARRRRAMPGNDAFHLALCICAGMMASESQCNPKIVDQIETGRHAEKLIAVHDDGDVILAEQGQEIGDRRVGGNRLEPP